MKKTILLLMIMASMATAQITPKGGRYFDLVDDCVKSNSFDFGFGAAPSAFTCQVWLKSDGLLSGSGANFTFFTENGAGSFLIGNVYDGDGHLQIYMPGSTAEGFIDTAYKLKPKTWEHLTIAYGKNSTGVYINGKILVRSTVASGTMKFWNCPTAYIGYPGNFSTGCAIAEFRLFDYCMTDGQVADTWTRVIEYTSPHLKLNYHFSETAGMVMDSSGRNVHLGTLVLTGTTLAPLPNGATSE